MKTADVIIVGGGVMGSSVAYHLLADGFRGHVLVIERDLSYTAASSALAVGGIRQQFGTEINILLTRYSVRFYEQFGELMEVDGERPDIGLRQKGYLFLATEAKEELFRRRVASQRDLGVEVEILDRDTIRSLVPGIVLEDIAFGVFGRRDGYFDPYRIFRGFIRKAKALGAEYLEDEVIGVLTRSGGVAGIYGKQSGLIEAPVVVNAAGAWARVLGRMAGVEVPVDPWRRQVYIVRPPSALPELPMVIDPTGLHFRTETGGLLIVARATASDGVTFDLDWDQTAFFEQVWPELAHRMPRLEQLRLERGWAGAYDMNLLDHNAILGEHPDLKGFYLINGFSGHGLMQAPAAGKLLSELISLGRYETIDAHCLGLERFRNGQLIIEEAVI